MTLVELKTEYQRARQRTDRKAKHHPQSVPDQVCRYCGLWWIRWAGSKLDGHSSCIVDERFKFQVRTVLADPRMTYRDIGLALEISPSVVRSWTFPIRATPIYARKK